MANVVSRRRYSDAMRRRYIDRQIRFGDAQKLAHMYLDGVLEKYVAAKQNLAASLKTLKIAFKDFMKKVLIFLKIKKPEASKPALAIVKQSAKSLAGAIKSNIGAVMTLVGVGAVAGGAAAILKAKGKLPFGSKAGVLA